MSMKQQTVVHSRFFRWFFFLAILLCMSIAGSGLPRARRRSSAKLSKKPSFPHYVLKRPLETNRTRRGHIRGQPFPAANLGAGVSALRAFEKAGLLQRKLPDKTKDKNQSKQSPSVRSGNKKGEGGFDGTGAEAERGAHPKPPSDLPEWMRNLKLPAIAQTWRPEFIKYLNFYRNTSRGRGILRSWYRNLGRFERFIKRELRRHGLPQDLLFLAAIESGFRPQTVSYAGAAGLWQFMPLGGRIYDLQSSHWLDERLNPERSTRAAMLYLKDLYFRFGDWPLALGAYNAGYAAVSKSIRRFNTNSYWKLCDLEAGLPFATSNYVPKFLAVATAAYNKKEFGLDNIKPVEEWSYSVFTIRRPVHLKKLARLTGVSYDALKSLNPELRRNRIPPGYKSFQIRIPKGSEEAFKAKTGSLTRLSRSYQTHVVLFGETLSDIAKKYNSSRGRLRRLNRISSAAELEAGLQIIVPKVKSGGGSAGKDEDDEPDEDDSPDNAEKEEESTGGNGSGSGKKLLVAVPARPPSAPDDYKRVFYRVTSADTLPRLKKVFSVKEQDLLSWNNLNPKAKLQWGMILQIFVSPKTDLSKVKLLDPKKLMVMVVDGPGYREEYLKSRGLVRLVYKARKNDTIRALSKRFGLSMGSIARLNGISRFAKLKPGQSVIVYVDPKSPAARHKKK